MATLNHFPNYLGACKNVEVPHFLDKAAAIIFLHCLVRFLFEGGFYLPQFPVGNSSEGTV